jgi:hypothetical protein
MHTANKYYMRKEALVWNTRLRMQRGVVVAGNGMSLLSGQTTKWDSIASVEGVLGGVVYKQGLGYVMALPRLPGSCRRSFYGADKRLPWFTETKATLSVDIVRVEFNLSGLPINVVHTSGTCGEDRRIVELNAVSVVDLCSPMADLSGCTIDAP